MAISNIAITNGGDDIFVCPGDLVNDPQDHAVTCIIFCNVSISSATLTLHAIAQNPEGNEPVSDTNMIIKSLTIPAGETFSFDTEKLVLSSGDTVHAIASINSALVATVSSMRVS